MTSVSGIPVSTNIATILLGNVNQMLGTSSYDKSEYCTPAVFTALGWILKLPLFRVSCVLLFPFCLLCNVQLQNVSPLGKHALWQCHKVSYFLSLQKMALLSLRRSTKSCWPRTDLTSRGVIHTWTRPSQ